MLGAGAGGAGGGDVDVVTAPPPLPTSRHSKLKCALNMLIRHCFMAPYGSHSRPSSNVSRLATQRTLLKENDLGWIDGCVAGPNLHVRLLFLVSSFCPLRL